MYIYIVTSILQTHDEFTGRWKYSIKYAAYEDE